MSAPLHVVPVVERVGQAKQNLPNWLCSTWQLSTRLVQASPRSRWAIITCGSLTAAEQPEICTSIRYVGFEIIWFTLKSIRYVGFEIIQFTLKCRFWKLIHYLSHLVMPKLSKTIIQVDLASIWKYSSMRGTYIRILFVGIYMFCNMYITSINIYK